MKAPLPVITTRRADRRDRGYLAWVAVANEIAHLPLDSAPIDASPHALEIHVDGFDEPLVVIAEPTGAPTDEGFPLRLSPLDDEHADRLRRELFGGEPAAESSPPPSIPRPDSFAPSARRTMSEPPISLGHAEALSRATNGMSTLSRRAPGSLTGRVIGDGRFSLEGLIGAGASGEVYRGVHTALRRAIAVKVLHPSLQQSQDYCARFYSEALAASQLDHRNVLRIIDYGQEPDGLLFIVMELLDGESLQEILDRSGPLPLERLVDLVSQACAGLAHAHDAGVVHRDIKPENIVVVKRRDDEGSTVELVKVCDFGIAHWSTGTLDRPIGDHEDTIATRPDTSKVVGTPAYMAPEQIRNDPVDARADVYALGVVLYELATGRLPFDSELPMEVLSHHLNLAPPRPSSIKSDIDPELERVILAAMEKDPEKRCPSARVLRVDLRELVDDDWSASTGQFRRVSIRNAASAEDFLKNPVEGIGLLATAPDDRSRRMLLDAAAEAIRTCIEEGNPKIARDLLAWLQPRSVDMAASPEEREQVERTLRVFRDPQLMGVLAGHVLDAKIARVDEAAPLLGAGGPVAARALLDGRRSRPPSLDTRGRFVAAMRTVGAASLPVVTGALEAIAGLATRNEEVLADDLLRSMPDTMSETAGEITVRFVRVDKPSLGALALATTAALWGRRAHPLLLGVLDSPSDPMRVVAIEALERLGAIDDWTVDRLARIIAAGPHAGDDLRVTAAEALSYATPEARPRAIAFLTQRLQPQGFVTSVLQAFSQREPAAVVGALARALVKLDASGARIVLEKLASARPELRADLERAIVGR